MVKKLNKRIKELESTNTRLYTMSNTDGCKIKLLEKITSNIDKYMYEVTFKYENKIYTEINVESFGTRWLPESIVLSVAKKNITIYSWRIEIISAKKLY